MKNYIAIENIHAIEILDSRGNPTIQVEVELEDGIKTMYDWYLENVIW